MQLLCYPIYLRLLLQATYANPAENPTHSNPKPQTHHLPPPPKLKILYMKKSPFKYEPNSDPRSALTTALVREEEEKENRNYGIYAT